jgi:hypothetical protein
MVWDTNIFGTDLMVIAKSSRNVQRLSLYIDILLKVEVGINCAGAGIIKESPAV